jgi:uncharacterized membrane protein YkvA (DUF1232 family)
VEKILRKLTEEQKRHLKAQVLRIGPKDEKKARERFKEAEAVARARGAARELIEQVLILWRMLIDPNYPLSWEVKIWIVFALVYFITPWDLIPDAIPFAGYVDDALVVMWAVRQIADEVDAYKRQKCLG